MIKYYYFGIDPGIKGALALIDSDGFAVLVQPLPTVVRDAKTGKKRLDAGVFAAMMLDCKSIAEANGATLFGSLELVHAMPGQGVVSMFSMGETFGIIQGCLCALKIPTRLVTPQFWKKKIGLTKDKEVSRVMAISLFPDCAKDLRYKKDHDKAEALLLATFSRLHS